MKTQLSILALCLAGLVLSTPAAAQTAPSGTNVALVDIAKVFENHPRFTAEMAAIKAEIEQFDAQARQRRDEIGSQGEKLRELKPESAEYRSLEKSLAEQSANLQVEATLKKKEIMEREAKLYYSVYTEVVGHIREFSRRYNIGLVLRYSSDEIDESDRNSVLQGVNRAVVHHQQLDITGALINIVNPRAATRPGNPQR